MTVLNTNALGYRGIARKRRANGCMELVARRVDVVLERGAEPHDYTHLQFCNAPIHKRGRCARHYAKPNARLDSSWRRFLRYGRAD